MTTTNTTDYSAWSGFELVDRSGEKIGKITQIYTDERTGEPTWVTVSTGLFGTKSSFVPTEGTTAEGDRLVSAWDKEKVKGAPQVEDDGDGYLSPEEERELYGYYGQDYGAGDPATGRDATAGGDTSGPSTDSAMTRSEEELNVGTAKREAGRARLRKYVVTEQVQTTVPVSHEEVRIEREPITDANRAAATDGPEISEEEHEVILSEERPVVQKEVVPKERVRLATETVTEQQEVTDEVRKERIEEEGADARRR